MFRQITVKRIPKPREAGISPIDREQRPRRWVVRMSSTWGGRSYYSTRREAVARAHAISAWYGIPLAPGVSEVSAYACVAVGDYVRDANGNTVSKVTITA